MTTDSNYRLNVGVSGSSTNGTGVEGVTTNGAGYPVFGVLGRDLGSSMNGVGVKGTSTSGSGVVGHSVSGNGVGGDSSSAPGVIGISGSNTGVGGLSYYSYGVFGQSNTFIGVYGAIAEGYGQASTQIPAVLGHDYATSGSFATSNSGVGGVSGHGFGVRGTTTNTSSAPLGFGVLGEDTGLANVGVEAEAINTGGTALRAKALTSGVVMAGQGDLAKTACNTTAVHDVFSIDRAGNVRACGNITGNAAPLLVTRTVGGSRVVAYGPRQSQPTIEDFGQAQLTNGQAYVRLDSAFAATIDPRANYLVFITPGGPNHGLYVSQRSLRGFVVRENPGGASTLVFDYRIVAKPFDTNAARLPQTSRERPFANLSGVKPDWFMPTGRAVRTSRPVIHAAHPNPELPIPTVRAGVPPMVQESINRDRQMLEARPR